MPQLDPGRPTTVFITGKKGEGKSELARLLWDTWPYDRLVIDPTGDVDTGPGTQNLSVPLPLRFPVSAEGSRVSLRFRADPGSPTYEDDLDRAVGLALRHPGRQCLLWADEVGELTRANRTPPNFRRALHQGRHYGLSKLLCGPRPIDINPLCISQADLVYVFKLPNPADRRRVADNIGWDPADFDTAVQALGRHEFLEYDSATDVLSHYPPLPLDRARRNEARSRTA